MKTPKGGTAVLALSLLAGPAFAQEAAPGPAFSLIGSATQKLTAAAPGWTGTAGTAWSFTADLKPRFDAGPAAFRADTTWTLPLTASLTSAAPTVAVSEAYFRLTPAEGLDLTFGQKRFNLGVGQTVTVGDTINPAVGFFDQKTGFRGAGAEWSPVSWASVSAGLSGDQGTASSPVTGALQASLLVDKLQVTVSTVARKDVTFNPAVGVSYDLAGVILAAEGAAEFLPQVKRPTGSVPTAWVAPAPWSEPALSASAGARWTPSVGDWDLTLAAEVLHWAQGLDSAETEAWKAALASATPASKAAAAALRSVLALRGRENAFFRFAVGTGGTFTVSAFGAVDLGDGSTLARGTVDWFPWDAVELTAILTAAIGTSGAAWEFVSSAQDRYQASLSTTYHF